MVTVTGKYGINKARIDCKSKGDSYSCNVYYDGKKKEKIIINKRAFKSCQTRGRDAADCIIESGQRTFLGPKMF